jgi:hypothetical protein
MEFTVPPGRPSFSENTPFFVQDNSRPRFTQDSFGPSAVRLTWQASKRNKINGFAESRNNTFGPTWGQPLSVLDARMLQLSADLKF